VRELGEKDPDVAIVWRAFELRPDPVPTLDPNGEYLHRVWGSSVYPLAENLGIDIKLPPVQPRSRRAHEAAHWARRHGKFREYNDALFRAFFQRGEDIGNTDVLVRLASDMGVDGDDLRAALDNDLSLENVLADEREAKKLGLSGVPAFVANRKIALSGVQSVESLQKLVEHARSLS
jgi:predicted DsbA family dithiol-disulfide isomerase